MTLIPTQKPIKQKFDLLSIREWTLVKVQPSIRGVLYLFPTQKGLSLQCDQ